MITAFSHCTPYLIILHCNPEHFLILCRSLIRRKPISVCLEEREKRGSSDGSGLAESLGLTDVLGYGIGCTVGAGIYSQIAIGVGVAGENNTYHNDKNLLS